MRMTMGSMSGLSGRQLEEAGELEHLILKPGKEVWSVGPVADALQAVHQVGEGLWEVRPEHQRLHTLTRAQQLKISPAVMAWGL